MNLHQFRFVQEAVRRDLNLTETAKALFTSQPGISKAILELEAELGIDIFARHGKRLRRVTEPGREVLKAIEIIMREVGNLKRIGEEYSLQDAGTLSIATTHGQARYFLPEPVAALRRRFPKVHISLHQGSPEQVAKMVLNEVADMGIATEKLAETDGLVTLPCYEWQHAIVMPAAHPLAQHERLSLEDLAVLPLVSYHPSFSGRTRVDDAFATRGLKPEIVLEAIDADVIKTYVRIGLGIGIVSELAVRDDPPGGDLLWRPAGHLFGTNLARIAFKRGAYLRNFVYTFAESLSERLGRRWIDAAMSGTGNDDYRAVTTPTFPTPELRSRLPNVGLTIFTVMSALAAEHGAVNLGQGFPDYDCDPQLVDAVAAAMRAGHNQYPPMAGVPALRAAVAAKVEALYGHRYDPDREVTITAGATQAIITAVLAVVHPGDEVIVLDPCYDSYEPSIVLAGGRAVHVPLTAPAFELDFDRLRAALGPRTRAIIVNTPHSPSGTTWSAAQMAELAALLRDTPVVVIADEVYEHMVYDGAVHQSVARFPELAARSFVISSFGKTYHVTGWKVGYVVAPEPLMTEFRKVHQFNVFTVNAPMQHGIAAYMAQASAQHLRLAAFYQAKRDLFQQGLARTRLRPLPVAGTYFQCVDYAGVSDLPEAEFCRWLTTEHGVAAIPVSVFYERPVEQRLARLCFAKKDATLQEALARLEAL